MVFDFLSSNKLVFPNYEVTEPEIQEITTSDGMEAELVEIKGKHSIVINLGENEVKKGSNVFVKTPEYIEIGWVVEVSKETATCDIPGEEKLSTG